MIFNAKAQDDLYRLIRHIENQMEKGSTFEGALANLRSIAGVDTQKLDYLEQLTKGNPSDGARLSPYPYKMPADEIIGQLLRVSSQTGSEPEQSMRALKACLRVSQNAANQVLKGVKTLSIYLVVMFSLAITCSSIYIVKVLPQFESLFSSVHSELPSFTKSALAGGEFLNEWWVVLIPIVIFLVYQMFQIGNRISALMPMGGGLKLFPGISKLRKLHFKYLVISYSYILTKGGLSGPEALDKAAMLAASSEREKSISKLETNGLFTDILIARQLNTLEPELDHAFYDIEHEYLSELSSLREKLMLSLQITMALIIGAIVIAMYLPIFQLGQVI